MARGLPSGYVTFAFTDVVGSTEAFVEHGERFVSALRESQSRIAAMTDAHGGAVVKTEGDGAFLVFASPSAAVACLQAILRDHENVTPLPLRLRAGLHSGEAVVVDDDYISLAVHVAARVSAAANAGQLLASQAVIDSLADRLGERIGEYELKGLPEPVTLWRLAGGDGPPRALPWRRTNVAASRTSFVGREDSLAELRQQLRAPGLVTIVGPGGVGKTRLVSELALAEDADHGLAVLLVELAGVEDLVGLVDAVAAPIGCQAHVDVIQSVLNERGAMVLVLDNCEHVLDRATEMVNQLLAHCPSLRLIATSREPLGLRDEICVRLRPLDTRAAEQLFLARAAAMGADVASFDSSVVATICDLLEGLPLGIELAAVQSTEMPLSALLESVSNADLAHGPRSSGERQGSLDSLVSWSLDRLDEADRDALVALSVLPAGFDLELAAAALSACRNAVHAPAQQLARLVRRSLVDLDGDRYRLLYVIRQVVQRHSAATVELVDSTAAALHDYAASWVPPEPRDLQLKVEAEVDRLTMLRPVLEDALEWALANRTEPPEQIFLALVRIGVTYGWDARTIRIAQRLGTQELPHPTGPAITLACRAIRTQLGAATHVGPAEERWRQRLEELRGTAQALDDEDAVAASAYALAAVLLREGDFKGARAYALEALERAQSVDPQRAWLLELDLAVIDHLDGRIDRAVPRYQHLLETAAAVGCPDDLAAVNLAEALVELQRWTEAVDLLSQRLHDSTKPSTHTAAMTGFLAEALFGLGRTDDATALAETATEQLRAWCTADPSLSPYVDRFAALAAPAAASG